MDWQNPLFFQRSLRIIDGVGKPGESGRAYRDPSPLPNGNLIVSMAEDVGDVGSFAGGFDLYVVNPVVPRRFGPVVADSADLLWPVAVYGRFSHGIFRSKLDEPNGASRIDPGVSTADVLFLDVPLLASLLFQNTRSERIIPERATSLEIWESLPPEPGVTSFAEGGSFVTQDQYGDVYVRRRLLGVASADPNDGSARVRLPGGMPISLATLVQFDGERSPTKHAQREEMQFYPGEIIRQGFRRDLFDGVCGSCHGSVTGYESHVAVDPDILTQASDVVARTTSAKDPVGGSADIQGPPLP
jgi:hypothetical protein